MDELWRPTHVAGSVISAVPLLFAHDSKHYFVAIGAAVKVYATASGEVVSVLHAPSAGAIVALMNNPDNVAQLISVSRDGCVCVWDYAEASVLHTWLVDAAITAAVVQPTRGSTLIVAAVGQFAATSDGGNDINRFTPFSDGARVVVIELPSDATERVSLDSGRYLFDTRSCHHLCIDKRGRHVVCAGGQKKVRLYDWYVFSTASIAYIYCYHLT